jgi:hypothetical protein
MYPLELALHQAPIIEKNIDELMKFVQIRINEGYKIGEFETESSSDTMNMLTGNWRSALETWRICANKSDEHIEHKLLSARVNFFEASRTSRDEQLCYVGWMTAHLPISMWREKGLQFAPAVLHPRRGLIIGPHTLPNFSHGLWETDLADITSGSPLDARLFSKVLPKRCRMRDFTTFISMYTRSSDLRKSLMQRAMMCTLLGLYPETGGLNVPSFETCRELYIWLYVQIDKTAYWKPVTKAREKATQQICTTVVRELMMYWLTKLPALRLFFDRMPGWSEVCVQTRLTLNAMRTADLTNWDDMCNRVESANYRVGTSVYAHSTNEVSLSILLSALQRGTASIDAKEMDFVICASRRNITGLINRLDECGQYSTSERECMHNLLRAIHGSESIKDIDIRVLDLVQAGAGKLASRLMLELSIVVHTSEIYTVTLPVEIAERQKSSIMRSWKMTDSIESIPQAAAFMYCTGCKQIGCRFIKAVGSSNLSHAHGSNVVHVDDETESLWCANRTSRLAVETIDAHSRSARLANSLICTSFPVVSVPLLGILMVHEQKGYSVCEQCAHITEVVSLKYGSILCTPCRNKQCADPEFSRCISCRNPFRSWNMTRWNVYDDTSNSLTRELCICTKCSDTLLNAGVNPISSSISDISKFRFLIAQDSIRSEFRANGLVKKKIQFGQFKNKRY